MEANLGDYFASLSCYLLYTNYTHSMKKNKDKQADFWDYIKLPQVVRIALDFVYSKLLNEKPEEVIIKDVWLENTVLTLIVEFMFHQISLHPPKFLYSHLVKFEISKEGHVVNYEIRKRNSVIETGLSGENNPPEAPTPH